MASSALLSFLNRLMPVPFRNGLSSAAAQQAHDPSGGTRELLRTRPAQVLALIMCNLTY